MAKPRPKIMFRKIFVPVIHGSSCEAALALARSIDSQGLVFLVGMVPIPEGESLSTAALTARKVRKMMRGMADDECIRIREKIHVAHRLWDDLVKVVKEEHPDLLVLEWPCQFSALHTTAGEVLAYPPCDVAIVSGPVPRKLDSVLVPLRGGPYAELALRLSLSIGRTGQAKVTSLHVRVPGAPASQEAAFRGIERVGEKLHHLYDARLTRIGDTIHILFAADTETGCKLGVGTTRDCETFDFVGLGSHPDIRNGVLFPEKMGGRFVRLDRPNRSALEGGVTSGDEIWLSSSDDLVEWTPEARVMKQSDGGYAPSYNVQVSTEASHKIIVGVGVSQKVNDCGELVGGVQRVEQNLQAIIGGDNPKPFILQNTLQGGADRRFIVNNQNGSFHVAIPSARHQPPACAMPAGSARSWPCQARMRDPAGRPCSAPPPRQTPVRDWP